MSSRAGQIANSALTFTAGAILIWLSIDSVRAALAARGGPVSGDDQGADPTAG